MEVLSVTFNTLRQSATNWFFSFVVLRPKLLVLNFLSILILLFVSLGFPKLSLAQQTSTLWGLQGELWTPQSRLPDFSFAGYHMGDDPIPEVPVVANVKDFGAKGDGTTDDSQAFLNAIAATSNGALFIPAGRYVITQILNINKSNIVLRGDGPGRTVLFFPKSLYDIAGPGNYGGSWSGWSWEGGVLWIQGGPSSPRLQRGTWILPKPGEISVEDTGPRLASVTTSAQRGDTQLILSSTSKISAGQTIRLVLYDDSNGTLMAHIGHNGGGFDPKHLYHVSRVRAVQGSQIILEKPLPTDVQLSWKPEIYAYIPSIEEVGLENFTIEFPSVGYAGHFEERGYNGIQFWRVANSWVRNITIRNADNGIFVDWNTRFTTIQRLHLTGRGGHHGVQVGMFSESNLITEFRFDNTFIHDITVQFLAHGNVFSNGSGVNVNFDHHRAAPFENLFSDIDIGGGSRPYASSGDPSWGGNNSAARETFWNIYKSDGTVVIKAPSWPEVNVIGGSHPEDLFPADIHQAQLALRLNDNTTPPPQTSQPPPPPSHSTILAAPTNVTATGNVTVNISNGPENRTDWVGLYSASAPAENGKWANLLSWQYLNGRQIPPSTGKRSATLSFNFSVSPGTYQFRFFANDRFGLLATSPNVIVTPTITASRATSLINSAAVMGHSKNFAADHPVEHLWDGCLEGTPACSAGAGNIASFWIEFDLGKLHDLTSARLFGDASGEWWSTSWSLKYKQNLGDPWTTSFENTIAFFNDWSTRSVPVTARYVRVEVLGNQRKRATQARELELFGTPRDGLALSSP